MLPKLHFRRFEFKYLIRPDQERAIKRALRPYVALDPFAAAAKSGAYEVVSLYFDSPRHYYYHEKIDGAEKRKKLRLRTYRRNGDVSESVFFEIKRKNDAIVMKDRFFSPRSTFTQFDANEEGYRNFIEACGAGTSVQEEYLRERRLRAIAPTLLVVYDREPFFGSINPNVRITFDKHIRACETDRLWHQGDDFTDVSRGATVMELKFNGVLPSYIHDIIKMFELQRVAFSKYCRGMEECGALAYPRFPRPYGAPWRRAAYEPLWNLF